MPQKITPNLWFDNNAEEAATFYLSVFKDAEILDVLRQGDAGPGAPGSALTVSFRLRDQHFVALNGGPHFKFNEAVSFLIDCESQDEVDYYWDALTADGGEPSQCGWLKDKYGLSWQVVPRVLIELLQSPDPARAGRVMETMMGMTKLDIAPLQRAHDGA